MWERDADWKKEKRDYGRDEIVKKRDFSRKDVNMHGACFRW